LNKAAITEKHNKNM